MQVCPLQRASLTSGTLCWWIWAKAVGLPYRTDSKSTQNHRFVPYSMSCWTFTSHDKQHSILLSLQIIQHDCLVNATSDAVLHNLRGQLSRLTQRAIACCNMFPDLKHGIWYSVLLRGYMGIECANEQEAKICAWPKWWIGHENNLQIKLFAPSCSPTIMSPSSSHSSHAKLWVLLAHGWSP